MLCCSCVHFRHPSELGGIYFFVNALVNVLSWFVAAALYSLYYPARPAELAHGVNVSTLVSMVNFSANVTGVNSTGVPPLFNEPELAHSLHATARAAGVNMHASKIEDLPLFAIVAALAVAWLVAVAGLSLTIKREYLHTFVSLQTGSAYAQSYFLENEGDDAKRVQIFFCNERQWQAIRNRVREWVLGVYAAWKALMPSWFTPDLQARIPDEFMPAQVVHELNAQAPGGRRPTLQNMGLLRRVSHAAAVSAEASSNSDGGLRVPARAHLELASPQVAPQIVEESMAIEERRMIDEAIAASLAEVERRETGGEVPERLLGSLSKAQNAAEVSDEDDYEAYQTLPDENEEP